MSMTSSWPFNERQGPVKPQLGIQGWNTVPTYHRRKYVPSPRMNVLDLRDQVTDSEPITLVGTPKDLNVAQ